VRYTISAFILLVVASTCTSKVHEPVDLRARIIAANPPKDRHSPNARYNPVILVLDNGYDVTIFSADKPEHRAVHTNALGEYLLTLPMSVWPAGPNVIITPSDDVTDSHSLQKNVVEAEHICRSLGLDIQFRPGG